MSKVRINDLAREMEVKSKQILDTLAELGLATGKTHSSSLEEDEAEKVRAQFERGSRSGSQGSAASSRAAQGIQPKIDLSHVSKPGDVLKAILANKQKEEQDARPSHAPARTQPPPVSTPARPAAAVPPPVAAAPAPARPEPRKIVPQPRSAPPIVVAPPAPPAIASRPPVGAVVAKPPAGTVVVAKPPVVVVAPSGAVVVKPPVAQPAAPAPREQQPRAQEPPAATKPAVRRTIAPATHDAATAAPQAHSAAPPIHSAAPAEPTAIAASVVSEPGEAAKETQVLAPVDVWNLNSMPRPRKPPMLLRQSRPFAAWSCLRPGRDRYTRPPS
jgi:translation initiation factor IF-2